MFKLGDETLYSASDLVAFLECPHSTTLDLINLETPLEQAEDDEHARLIQDKGFAHEAAHLATLKHAGDRIVELAADSSVVEGIAATRAAMGSGADVIFQASLKSGPFFGRADFLRKV